MHELSLCQSILDIVKTNLPHPGKVKAIYLEVGKLAAIEKSAMLLSFNVLTQGTIAENAVLHFTDIPGKAWCDFCQKAVAINQYFDPCPRCGKHALKVLQGEELRVTSMEVE